MIFSFIGVWCRIRELRSRLPINIFLSARIYAHPAFSAILQLLDPFGFRRRVHVDVFENPAQALPGTSHAAVGVGDKFFKTAKADCVAGCDAKLYSILIGRQVYLLCSGASRFGSFMLPTTREGLHGFLKYQRRAMAAVQLPAVALILEKIE